MEKMLKGEQPIINGSGEQTRDFVYVDDVVKANLAALRSNKSERVFNIGTGIETSVNQLFILAKEIIDPSIKEKHGPGNDGEQMRSVVGCSRANKIMSWQPMVSIIDGLKKTFDYFRASA